MITFRQNKYLASYDLTLNPRQTEITCYPRHAPMTHVSRITLRQLSTTIRMMKVILTGSTGFIGREVLSQCLAHPAITSIVALTRRELPAHEKLKVTLIEDFMTYPDAIRDEIRDAEACIWYDPCQESVSGRYRLPFHVGHWAKLTCLIMISLDK